MNSNAKNTSQKTIENQGQGKSPRTLKDIATTLRYRWVVWGVMALSYMIVYFHSYSMGVVKGSLIAEYGITEDIIVSIGNVYFWVYLLMQLPTGILADTLGARMTAVLGTLVAAIGTTLFSFSQDLTLLFVGRGLVELGTAVIFVSIIKIQSTWFKESEFGTITGLTCFIGVMGGAVAQTPLAMMVEAMGWRFSFQLIGMASVAIAAIIFFVARNKPEELGMAPLNISVETGETKETNIFKSLLAVFFNPRTWPLFISYAAYYGSFVIITGYFGTSFISDVYGISTINASSYIIAAVLGAAVGSVVVGWVSDKMLSRKKPLVYTGLVYVAVWAYVVFANGGQMPQFMLVPTLFMIGFASCAYVMSWPAVKEVNDPAYVGVSAAVANIGGFTGTIAIPPLVANVFVSHGDTLSAVALYQKAFFIVLVSVVLGWGASLLTKETGCKNIYVKRQQKEAA